MKLGKDQPNRPPVHSKEGYLLSKIDFDLELRGSGGTFGPFMTVEDSCGLLGRTEECGSGRNEFFVHLTRLQV